MKPVGLKQKLIDFLQSQPKHLKEMYTEFSDYPKHSVRGRLNEGLNKSFKRIAEGIYLAIDGDTKALIIQGDSWEAIKDFEDNSIDTIITDPAYVCLNKHYEIGTTKPRNRNKHIGFVTQEVDKELLQQMQRVLKVGGHMFIFSPACAKDTITYNNTIIEIAMNLGLEFNKRFIWNKMRMGMGYNGRNSYEQIFFFSKGKRHKPYNLAIKDVLSHQSIHFSKRKHDAEKPIELIQDLMKFSCKEKDVCLDLFGGSMSTMFAGLLQGVHTISIELEQSVIERAVILD